MGDYIIVDLKLWLLDNVFTKSGTFNNRCSLDKWWGRYPDKYRDILEATAFLPTTANLKYRLECILQDIKERPVCKTCGGDVKLHKNKFSNYCSSKCAAVNTETKNKRRITTKEKYGVDYVSQSPKVRRKIETSYERLPSSIAQYLHDKEWLYEQHVTNKKTLTEIVDLLFQLTQEITYTTTVRSHIDRFNIPFTYHKNGYSLAERELNEFIGSLGFTTILNFRDLKYELDIFLPSKNIALEYNGLYWHHENSPSNKTRLYHLNKTKLCADNGIRLIHVFEDEWLNRKDQVKGFLKSLLGKNPKTVYARKCQIKQISKQQSSDFINQYHIQPLNMNKIKYSVGLFYNDELLGVMTFGKHHRQETSCKDIVLNRMVFKEDYTVVGGASKMLKYSINNILKDYDRIISWSDNRWSSGNVYKKIGFSYDKSLPPDYTYVSTKGSYKRIPKQSMTKKKIGARCNQTELQRTLELGYSRIWDCGKIRWVYDIKKSPD